jgi:hypothetical protein
VVLRVLYFHYIEYRHIWLNIFKDYCHFCNKKTEKQKEKKKKAVCFSLKEDKMVKKGWQGAGKLFFSSPFRSIFLILKAIFVYSQSDDHL